MNSINNLFLFKDLIFNCNAPLAQDKTLQRNILALFNQKMEFLKNSEKIHISHACIYSLEEKQWHTIQPSKADQKIIDRILKIAQTEKLVLTRDFVGEKIKTVLEKAKIPSCYLFSSGGGGHKTAKDALIEKNFKIAFDLLSKSLSPELSDDIRVKNLQELIQYCKKTGFIHERDILHDCLGSFGVFCSNTWDEAQKSGNIQRLEILAASQWILDLVLTPFVFFYSLYILNIYKPEVLISTQVLMTRAILFAIKIYNKFYRSEGVEKTKIHLYITDMPTEKCFHFFRSIKNISQFLGKEYLVLHSPKAENLNWDTLCNLPDEQVRELSVEDFPVRPDFLSAAETFMSKDNKEVEVQIKVSSLEELSLLKNVLKNRSKKELLEISPGTFSYRMQPEDEKWFIMLGSQPSQTAIEAYIDRFIKIAKMHPQKNYHLFAYTGKFEERCFYKKVCKKLLESSSWPPNLSVIPLSFQNPHQLVGLEIQCDTVTRSGGATVMELLVLEKSLNKLKMPLKHRWIHVEKINNRKSEEALSFWEAGNYSFLKQALGIQRVSITSPDSFSI